MTKASEEMIRKWDERHKAQGELPVPGGFTTTPEPPDRPLNLHDAAQVGEQECHPAACRDELLWRKEIATTIERCAQVAEKHPHKSCWAIADQIRKLKDEA